MKGNLKLETAIASIGFKKHLGDVKWVRKLWGEWQWLKKNRSSVKNHLIYWSVNKQVSREKLKISHIVSACKLFVLQSGSGWRLNASQKKMCNEYLLPQSRRVLHTHAERQTRRDDDDSVDWRRHDEMRNKQKC